MLFREFESISDGKSQICTECKTVRAIAGVTHRDQKLGLWRPLGWTTSPPSSTTNESWCGEVCKMTPLTTSNIVDEPEGKQAGEAEAKVPKTQDLTTAYTHEDKDEEVSSTENAESSYEQARQ